MSTSKKWVKCKISLDNVQAILQDLEENGKKFIYKREDKREDKC